MKKNKTSFATKEKVQKKNNRKPRKQTTPTRKADINTNEETFDLSDSDEEQTQTAPEITAAVKQEK